MAVTTNHSNNELIKFKREVTYGYLRNSRLSRYQGTSANAVIRLVKDLQADGKEIRVPLVDQLRGQGLGTGTLTGNEEAIDNYGAPMWADWLRHAVRWNKATDKDSALNIRNIATPLLSNFGKRMVRDETIDAMLSIPTATPPAGFRGPSGSRINGIRWADATPAQRNNWFDANGDRIVVGAALGNRVAGSAASSLANVDTTSDRLGTGIVSLAKRVAMSTTENKITPYMVDDTDEEMYVMFVGSRAMRDLKNDDAMKAALREARPREGAAWEKNPLFKAGDLWWVNVLVTEIPEIDERLTLTGAGAAGSNVVPGFLCGVSALAYVMGQMPTPTQADETDYQFNTGIGTETQYGIGKVAKIPPGGTQLKDWGMVTVFTSSVADA
ncbi:phage capsid family protein [Microvirga yunnanensis]|uniref:phage capsid family protein n=1 Tax=Microvirga yunnanensis TaxID=2953740 RepID=UPI0021C851C8|nr:DUF4043 family protein [Microvirga sp. HBU65207]